MKKDLFALKGTICYSKNQKELVFAENSYAVCENGLCAGVFSQLPEEYKDIPVKDMGDRLIIPGFTDLHLHAPQYAYRGTGMDLELLDWLNTITFPQEAKYADLSYAKKAYSIFVDDLKHSFTTRACIFATLHRPATELLMDMLEESGLATMVGKVNMDRNGAPELQEKSAQASAQDTRQWLEEIKGRYDHTYPILTPRFTPSCTDELMTELGKIQREYHIPIQSHLSENFGEIAWVKELCPTSRFYGDAYDMFGLFGTKPAANEEVSNPASASSNTCPTIMAHCVHSTDEEIQMIKDQGVYIAHCPESNTDIASGIAPIRRYLDMGLHVGLGTDVAGGFSLSMFRAIADAIQVSKLRWRLMDQTQAPVTLEEAFYMATIGGGSFFGKVGSFEKGYEFDAMIPVSYTHLTIATEGRAKYNAYSQEEDRDIYKGLTFWSPNVNIFRDPRWGRGHETYGEDPYLTKELGVSFVKGLQGDGKVMKAAACAKHFAVHSGPEAIRHEFDAIATPKDMEETYLPAFEALTREADVEGFMGAYNRTNGEPCCGSCLLYTSRCV